MSNNPLNLAFRFLLEIILVIIFGNWGWHLHLFGTGFAGAITLPLVAATIWGVFKVNGDPGKAIVPIPGRLRLAYELLLFTVATILLSQLSGSRYTQLFLFAWLIHYSLSYDRISRLLRHPASPKNE